MGDGAAGVCRQGAGTELAFTSHWPVGDNELIHIRPAVAEDASAMARAHVRSWQAGYRGLLPADYLDALRPEDRARGPATAGSETT